MAAREVSESLEPRGGVAVHSGMVMSGSGLEGNVSSREATVFQRASSSLFGAVVTSLVVTPLDVVKTRMQAQASGGGASGALCVRCGAVCYEGVVSGALCPAWDPGWKGKGSMAGGAGAAGGYRINGVVDGVGKIARYEGIGRLYSGLSPTLVMAVPNTVLYFVFYDELKGFAERHLPPFLAHMLSGVAARTVAVTAVAPIEFARTRIQASAGRGGENFVSVVTAAVRDGGLGALYRGVGPTLLRDVPFSALYFAGYERLKTQLRAREDGDGRGRGREEGLASTFGVSFTSGVVSGAFASILTTPADVIKTHIQIQGMGHRNGNGNSGCLNDPHVGGGNNGKIDLLQTTRQIVRTHGWAGLMTGVVPRVAKIAPACGIMISSYEVGKWAFSSRNRGTTTV